MTAPASYTWTAVGTTGQLTVNTGESSRYGMARRDLTDALFKTGGAYGVIWCGDRITCRAIHDRSTSVITWHNGDA